MRALSKTLPMRRSLLLLLPIATLAALQAVLLPPWPRLRELTPAQVRQPLEGLALEPRERAAEPPWRNPEIALSRLHRWRLPQGLELQVQQVAVQRRPDFQLAMATRAWTPGRAGLALDPQRRLVQEHGSAWASGRLRLQGQPLVTQQTCLLPVGSGVTARQLGALADRGSDRLPLLLARLLGLQPNRSWHCLMISLSHRAADPQASAAAAALWPRLLKALAPLAS